ncbi:hypothetical protein HPG69_019315 [Diceros bicornis minor]|uniref:Uncharacterized protein n=1 Tax=Diceros bicornis minor TaxID=77932 RepID=A0A7J7FNS6_DICBM|nr:hypothetical protein HPG69_019315 [Diceros bicornis minor]
MSILWVNRYMKELNVKVVLTGLEIWTERNLAQISVNLQETLQNFNCWRDGHLLRRVKHDVAHMIVGQSLGKYQGHAFLSGICTAKNTSNTPHFTALVAHELGHNLGMKHHYVACKSHGQNLRTMHEFITLLHKHRGDCLFNKPELQSAFGKPYCRNKIVHKGDECDCGSVLDCQKDQCCLPSCQVKKGSDCAFGSCCKKLKISKGNHSLPPQYG